MNAPPATMTLPAVAIIGTGPSALYCLAHLLRWRTAARIVLFEAGQRAGVGTPYERRHNPPEMLANIASIELPPVRRTLLEWLRARPGEDLARLGITADQLHDRHFFPRMVLGEYFGDELSGLIAEAAAAGISAEVRTGTRIVDMACDSAGVTLQVLHHGEPETERFDLAVIATGHQAPRAAPGEPGLTHPYREPEAVAAARRLGIVGTSLSAIDVAVSHAARLGQFVQDADGLRWEPSPGEEDRRIAMLSRSGLLPEADFYCPIPYEPLPLFTPAAVAAAIDEPEGALDRLFALFVRQLAEADPGYSADLDLAHATADDFADRYFAKRIGANALDWAEANLAEVRRNAAARRTVPWRYAILRMHEAFGAALEKMDEGDRTRFDRGLKRVFVDNYAAVPPLSIERLLALHRAGVLEVAALGSDYAVEQDQDDGWTVRSGAAEWRFDALVDARGQGALGLDEFPFPTLRLQLRARALQAGTGEAGLPLEQGNALGIDSDALGRVFCLALPFVMWRNPFVQGLTAAHDMGRDAATAIAGRLARPAVALDASAAVAAALGELDGTTIVLHGTAGGLAPLTIADPDRSAPAGA